jgi:hypothetical protein
MRSLGAVALSCVLGGCDGGVGESAGECPSLALGQCGSRPECVVLTAEPLEWQDEARCYALGPALSKGCRGSEVQCAAVLTYAAPTVDADCWLFPTACIPQGWSACTASPTADVECD